MIFFITLQTLLPGFIHPQHIMATNYKYNTLNQITSSYQPDHDSVSVTYYDILSRPVLSQNGKQRTEHKYSYTLYDSLGRIVEVGQVVNTSSISQADAADTRVVAAFIADGTRTEITRTYYDSSLLNTASGNNLRNRIAAVAFYPQYQTDSLAYQTATHYSYDIHGNVKRLVQDIPALDSFSRKLTYIDYEYDLVSGNVNKVWFQKSCPEQIMHRYRYDADNRLTHVYTSATTDIKLRPLPQSPQFVTMERLDARYFYLPNGMLSRVELGQKNVQGTDYAYTLQGWLKDINGYGTAEGLTAAYDIGHDGQLNMGTINSGFCRDAFSSMLQYYQGDYSPVSGTNYYNKEYNSATSLFNGNISALSTSFPITEGNLMLKNFRYDKLNRIKSMQTATLNVKTWGALTNMFATTYTYDYNGNFTQLKRNDYTGHWIHRIDYQYIPKNNRLNAVTAVGIASSSYHYDAIGNLTRDTGEGLDISWNAAGKVDTIWKNGNVLSTFSYSATGQRQVKKTGNNTYYYIHDASGNVMCIYRQLDSSLYMEEQPIYGSKRLGEYKRRMQIPSGTLRPEFTGTIGYRQYELTDHLGNVMATILDRRQNYSSGDATYKPYIISTTDYYPFGYPISNRSANIGGYRYFFNGQEGDNEVFGEVALHAFEYRMHDARLGRFWSVDPLAAKYPWNSTYTFAENSPIGYLEMEGLEKVQFGKYVVNFSNLDEKQVKFYLKKYRDYHHGNIKAKEIMQIDNDNEYWKVSDISDTYMRSIGTRIVKFNEDKTTTLSDNVRMNVGQFITRYGDLEGHHDGSLGGRITREDVIVGSAIVSIITGTGAMLETEFSILGTASVINSLDDVVGIFTNGKESFSQNCFSSHKTGVNIAKTAISTANMGMGIKEFKGNVSKDQYYKIMSTIMEIIGTGNNINNTVSDEKKIQQQNQ